MIGDLGHHESTKFTCDESVIDKALRFVVFDDLEEISWVYKMKEFKLTVKIKRPDQCDIAVYQLKKLQMSKLCYDFLDKYTSR